MLICSHNFVNFYSCLNEGNVGIPLRSDLVILYVLCFQRQSQENLPVCLFITYANKCCHDEALEVILLSHNLYCENKTYKLYKEAYCDL